MSWLSRLADKLDRLAARKARTKRTTKAAKRPSKKRSTKSAPKPRNKAERIALLKKEFLRLRADQHRGSKGDRRMYAIENELQKLGVIAKRVGFQKTIRWVKV